MRRCILIDSRVTKDKKTNEDVMYLTLAKLAKRTSEGNIYHLKKDDMIVLTAINKVKKPQEFAAFENIHPGALIDIDYSVSEFDGKAYISKKELVVGTNVNTPEKLYL